MPKPEGGYAFPKADLSNSNGSPSEFRADGMTLRQWYAGMIPVTADELPSSRHGCAVFLGVPDEEYDGIRDWPKVVAKFRFQVADAMIAESEKNV